MKFVLAGKPMSTQNCYRTTPRGGYMTKVCKELKDSYVEQIRKQWSGPAIEDRDLTIEIWQYHGDKRKRDWDNYNKLCTDAMEGIVFKDDVQIVDAAVYKRYDKNNPRIEIELFKNL